MGGAGRGNEAAPPCVIDECDGFGSNAIYHRGRAEFTSIFILRKLNCDPLSSGILRQRTMNTCGHKHECLHCRRLKKLRCGQLSSQAIGGEEKPMVDKFKNFHPCERGLRIIDDLGEISIIEQVILDFDSKLSLGSQIQPVTVDSTSMSSICQTPSSGTKPQFSL